MTMAASRSGDGRSRKALAWRRRSTSPRAVRTRSASSRSRRALELVARPAFGRGLGPANAPGAALGQAIHAARARQRLGWGEEAPGLGVALLRKEVAARLEEGVVEELRVERDRARLRDELVEERRRDLEAPLPLHHLRQRDLVRMHGARILEELGERDRRRRGLARLVEPAADAQQRCGRGEHGEEPGGLRAL